MRFAKCFVVLIVLLGRSCMSKIMIEIDEPNGFAKLGEATIKILRTCYRNQDKTIVLLGDYPGNFIKRLSVHRFSSLILFDDRRRSENNVRSLKAVDSRRMHKVHIVVSIVTHYQRSASLLATLRNSIYTNAMASLLIIKWSPENKYAGCQRRHDNVMMFSNAGMNDLLNVNVVCSDRSAKTLIYGYNPYVAEAPRPWRLVVSLKNRRGTNALSLYARRYREGPEMCENLDFEKTRDLGGAAIDVIHWCWGHDCFGKPVERSSRGWAWIEEKKQYGFIPNFFDYANATMNYVWKDVVKGQLDVDDGYSISSRAIHMRGVGRHGSYTLAHGTDCKFLLTQFRGYKSQLAKIISVIDDYSWIGMGTVYVVTLVFLKFFLRQSLLTGLLNLVRLICNGGLVIVPPNVAPRIYLSCLLFFVVTIQGIFMGKLASLLTHNVPLRQVDTIRDLADLGYNVYVEKADMIHFEDPAFEGRIMTKLINERCVRHVLRDPLVACLTWSAATMERAMKANLYRSSSCIAVEYIVNAVPWKWAMEERLNKYLGIVLGAGIMMPLEAIVVEKRLLEIEAMEQKLNPEVMTLVDLAFAFKILGIGLGLATVTFVVEIIAHRCHRRVTTTRVTVLN